LVLGVDNNIYRAILILVQIGSKQVWKGRRMYFVLFHRVVWYQFTDVSDVLATSIIRAMTQQAPLKRR
jgi:hypothetical protein